jgi:predicted ATPase/DNA-binding SARP family transcriptional activator
VGNNEQMLTLGVLGPIRLWHCDGTLVRLGSSRQRRLLAALALHDNAPVGDDLLAELVWSDSQPVDAAGALYTNVARLRRVLPDGVEIVTEPGAYRLVIDPEAVDAVRFGAQLAAAQLAAGKERADDERLVLLEAGLGLWRGRPYEELDHPAVTAAARRLTELRSSSEELRGELMLSCGRAQDAVADLEALIARERYREAPVALLMRALWSLGRHADALSAYTRLRKTLEDELGIEPSPELRRLELQVLRQELVVPLPAERRGVARPSLPVSTFVGRDDVLAGVLALLGRHRIVTVIGPGGVGKTRLARHVAHALWAAYADGVVWVDLGAVLDPSEVQLALATELRLSVPPGESLIDRVIEVLAVHRQLVVLDNCEQVAEKVAPLAERIAAAAPGVDILLTSREPLRADGEQRVVLAPLDEAAAVELLLDRLRAVIPEVGAADDDIDVVVDIARRLEGLPLALELAAARVPGFGLRTLRDALDEPFEVLDRGRRTAPPRHRSLLDVVDWSYRLLTESQADLFVQLGIFVGPVERHDVATVCTTDAPIAATLADLVDRSLLTLDDGQPVTYRMLDTLRGFGRRRLARSSQLDDLQQRHTRWAVELAEQVLAAELTPQQPEARRRFDTHLPDLRLAHTRLRELGRVDDLLSLTLVFAHHAYHRLRVDLVRIVEDTLAELEALEHPQRVRLLGLAANFGWQRGDLAQAEQRADQALALADVMGAVSATAPAREARGAALLIRGDLEHPRPEIETARRLAHSTGDRYTEALALCDLGLVATFEGDNEAGSKASDALEALAAEVAAPSIRGWAAYLRGERLAQEQPKAALDDLTSAVGLAEQVDDRFLAGAARHALMTTTQRAGNVAHDLTSLAVLVDYWHTAGAWTQLWITIRAVVEALSRQGRHHDAALLLGAESASRRAPPAFGADAERMAAAMTAARDSLGDAADEATAEGEALSDDDAIALVRTLTRQQPS